jgi:gliding motility-associated-like protein
LVNGCPDTFKTSITGTQYQWAFGPNAIPPAASGANMQSVPAFFTAPGTYTVHVYVTTPCCGIVHDSLIVNVQSNTLNVSLTASKDTICQGSTIIYTAAPSGYTLYSFLINDSVIQSTTGTTFQTSALAPGDSVKVLGFNGVCYTNPSATLHPVVYPIPAAPAITSSVPNDTICTGDTVTFTATPGYDTYSFFVGSSGRQSGPQNVWTTDNLYANNAIKVIATKNGCPAPPSNIIPMVVKPTPTLNLTVSASDICQGTSITATASSIPVVLDNYNFTINQVSVQNTSSNTYTSSAFNNNDTIYVSGSLNGCQSRQPSVPIGITVHPIPTVTLASSAANDSICQGQPITFTASPATSDTFIFSNNNTPVQTGSSSTYTTSVLANGSTITVIAVNYGCASTPSNAITTTVNPAPAITLSPNQPVCADAAAVTLTGFNPTGGTWSGQGITSPSGTFDPATAGTGIHWLYYTYTDPNSGCPATDSVTFTVDTLPVPVVQANISICEGQSAQLTANGGATYVWSPGTDLSNPNIANPVASPSQNTSYAVTVTDNNQCSATASSGITVSPNPVADYTATQVCAGQPTVFTNTSTPAGSNTYLWLFGDGNSSTDESPSHSYTVADSFNVKLIAQLGTCFDTAMYIVPVYPAATADFNALPLTGYSDNGSPISFSNLSSNSNVWNWDFGDQTSSSDESPFHNYTQPGVYTIKLTASNQYGCADSLTKQNYIYIYPTPKVFVPNAFTPNGDGQNDVLTPFVSGSKYFDFMIFNRWGEKVFQTDNPNFGWDGTFKGDKAPFGVYIYHLKVVFTDNTTRDMKGSITLLK